jgi:hypothetical protein
MERFTVPESEAIENRAIVRESRPSEMANLKP